MKSYLWRFTSRDGLDIVAVLNDVLGLLEKGAAQGRDVLDVTGEDVAAFCDKSLRDSAAYQDKWPASLNRDVAKRLAG